MTPKSETKPKRTSVGSGKTRGAVSLANVNLKDLLKIVKGGQVPIGRVFAESHGFKLKKSRKKGVPPTLVLADAA